MCWRAWFGCEYRTGRSESAPLSRRAETSGDEACAVEDFDAGMSKDVKLHGVELLPHSHTYARIEEEEIVDMKTALPSDPITGVEQILLDEHGPGALEARPLSSPPTMTPAQRAKHNLTHLPYHPGCAICVATRRPNTMHMRSHEDSRVIPLLVADYCFRRFAGDTSTVPTLVMRLYPYKLFFCCVVPQTGVELSVVREIVNFIRTLDLPISLTGATGNIPLVL